MAAIKVKNHRHIDRAYTKDITFRRKLHTHHVHLLWDEHEGYKMWWFKDAEHNQPCAEPDWVKNYQPQEGDDGQYNLAIQLDALCIDKGDSRIIEHLQDMIDEQERDMELE
jgi:hypothetical protein